MENLVTKVSKILDEFVCNRTQLRLYKNEFKHFAFKQQKRGFWEKVYAVFE